MWAIANFAPYNDFCRPNTARHFVIWVFYSQRPKIE